MFKSYAYVGFLGFSTRTNLCSYEYELVDTTFTAKGVATDSSIGPAEAGTITKDVIKTYSKRNLNVPLNLALCMIYMEKQCYWWSIERQIEYNRQYVPNFAQYEKDIQRYLLLV